MAGVYDSALAEVHADRFAQTYAQGFDWLAGRIAERAAPRLLDLGCGDGTWLAHAAARGIPGRGTDISPAFVKRAQARGLDVRLGRAAATPIPDGTTSITALGEVLSYIDPELDAPSLFAVLARAAQGLPPGGTVHADLIGPETPEGEASTEGTGWRMRSEVRITGTRLQRRIEVETEAGRQVTTHLQEVLHPQAVLDEARTLGFRAEVLPAYGPAPLLPGRFLLEAVLP